MNGDRLVEVAPATDCRVHTSAFVIKVNGTGCCGAAWGRTERAALPGIVSPESCRLLMEGSCCSLVSKVTSCICTRGNGCTAGLNLWVSQGWSQRASVRDSSVGASLHSDLYSEFFMRNPIWAQRKRPTLPLRSQCCQSLLFKLNPANKQSKKMCLPRCDTINLSSPSNTPAWFQSFRQGQDTANNYCPVHIYTHLSPTGK